MDCTVCELNKLNKAVTVANFKLAVPGFWEITRCHSQIRIEKQAYSLTLESFRVPGLPPRVQGHVFSCKAPSACPKLTGPSSPPLRPPMTDLSLQMGKPRSQRGQVTSAGLGMAVLAGQTPCPRPPPSPMLWTLSVEPHTQRKSSVGVRLQVSLGA